MHNRIRMLIAMVVAVYTICSFANCAVDQKKKPVSRGPKTATHNAVPALSVKVRSIPSGPKALTYNDVDKISAKHLNRVVVDAYKSNGNRNPKWDDDAISFIEYFVTRYAIYANGWHSSYSSCLGKESADAVMAADHAMVAKGRDVIARGCHDPIVQTALGYMSWMISDFYGSAHFFQDALEGFKKNPKLPRDVARLAPIYLIMSHEMVHDLKPSDERAWRQLANKWTAEAQCDGSFSPDENSLLYQYLFGSYESFFEKDLSAFYKALKSASKPDIYFVKAVGGRIETLEGWVDRGNAFASEVTNDGWKKFHAHLAAGRKLLIEAWKMKPTYPDAPTSMIVIAMAGNGDDEPRIWFDRAVAAQIDYATAYHYYEYALLPRWGGSTEQLYDFGVECLNTKRYDTFIPLQLLKILQDIQDESEQSRICWSTPEAVNHLAMMFDGYKKSDKLSKYDPYLLQSLRAATAWNCGLNDEAKQLCDALGNNLITELFNDLFHTPYETARTGMDKGIVMGGIPTNPENGHHYEYRSLNIRHAITWDEADLSAKSLTYKSMRGHLASITSESENNYVNSICTTKQAAWAGGYKEKNIWKWTTGEDWSFSNPGKSWGAANSEMNMVLDTNSIWEATTKETKLTSYLVEYE